MIFTEAVVRHRPLVIQRRVKWGECDPAGVVYTPAFVDYVISAAELFYGEILGSLPQAAKHTHGFGTPTRAMNFDFRLSLRPDDIFLMTVMVAQVRERSYVLEITGRTPIGAVIFVALLTPVCVARSERRGIRIPDVFREALVRYRHETATVGETKAEAES
jgi:acyl-CoA thioester hydrolase